MKLNVLNAENINSKEYWDDRFSSDHKKSWRANAGENQTKIFAYEIVKRLKMNTGFQGTILDFGCALGDAIPIYKKHYPKARFIGIDFSTAAIDICIQKFGDIATFMARDVDSIPSVDVIIMSNVLEHLPNDKAVVEKLLSKCKDLYIAVPYDEQQPLHEEHVNSYNRNTFDYLNADKDVYLCRGYTAKQILTSYIYIELKNIIRPLFNVPLYKGGLYRQILYHIKSQQGISARN
ncbi:class I SAM-dependent methyltransferase [Chitinophaga filiformis]|uniref:Methyltransferase domain-containing protein n=1 Tax=Chitinophaga filiformis TaxID=104663 RepID=A0A1G8AB01_CHIFI|nr:class I SAM-dependent methyltransferase [Chitinophaga filiformis]SDH18033.1 Methyltransferase domain-containing protein [Chitinophaga filiformis]